MIISININPKDKASIEEAQAYLAELLAALPSSNAITLCADKEHRVTNKIALIKAVRVVVPNLHEAKVLIDRCCGMFLDATGGRSDVEDVKLDVGQLNPTRRAALIAELRAGGLEVRE